MDRNKLMYGILIASVLLLLLKSLVLDPAMLTTKEEYKAEIPVFDKAYHQAFGDSWWYGFTNSRIVKITEASEYQIEAAKKKGAELKYGHKATYRVYLLYVLPVREYSIIK